MFTDLKLPPRQTSGDDSTDNESASQAPTRRSTDTAAIAAERSKKGFDAVRLSSALSEASQGREGRRSLALSCSLTTAERADLHTLFSLLAARCGCALLFAGPPALPADSEAAAAAEKERERESQSEVIISRAEFISAFATAQNSALIHRIYAMLAADSRRAGEEEGEGGVGFESFAAGLAPVVAADATRRDRLRFLFDACDLDGSGHVTPDELHVLLHHACGVPAECVEAVVEATIRRLDADGDGLICWGEFEEYYASRPDELRQLTAHLGLSVNRITARLVMSLDAAGSAHSRPPPRPSAGSASPPPGSRAGLAPPPGPRAPGDTSRVVSVLSASVRVDPLADYSLRRSAAELREGSDPIAMRADQPPPFHARDTDFFGGATASETASETASDPPLTRL
mmetsp:Transcript_9816/g.28997  ORF Transcript_9816/g.28997 Transcript_9816/m.28997 type:complete len:401 (+) Transcript_9816:69-1271(+)